MKRAYMLALLLVCSIGTQAFADNVLFLRQDFQSTQPDFINCGTFSVTFDVEGHLTGIARFRDGVLMSDTDHITGTGALINQTTLKTLTARFAWDLVFDPKTGGGSAQGLFLKFSSPQGGTFTLAAGRFVIDSNGNVVFMAGRQEDVFDPTKICAALE